MSELQLDRPVFIVGSGSSGTTLLGVMLDRHPELACGPELYAFDKRQIYGSYRRVQRNIERWLDHGLVSDGLVDTADFFHGRPAYFCDSGQLAFLAREAGDLRSFFDAFFRQYLQHRGKQRWAEKTGSNAYYLRNILDLYPQAKIIHLVRDGRDVACSLAKRDASPYHAVSHWLYNVSAAIAWRGHPAYLEIRYEDLASRPVDTLQTVCRHLEVQYDPGMLKSGGDDYWQKHAAGNVHNTWANSPFAGGVSDKSVGRWRTDMHRDVEALFWRMRLTRWARHRLGVRHYGVTDLMCLLGYAWAAPIGIRRAPVYLCRDGWREGLRRAGDYWRRNRRLWLPLTWVDVMDAALRPSPRPVAAEGRR